MDEQAVIIQQLKEYFEDVTQFDVVILYGSFAKGTYNKTSDIDIAFHSKTELSSDTLLKIKNDITLLCKREVDLADLSKAESIFLYQIMTTGKRIKADRTVYVNYLMKALGDKEDFIPYAVEAKKEKVRRFLDGQ